MTMDVLTITATDILQMTPVDGSDHESSSSSRGGIATAPQTVACTK